MKKIICLTVIFIVFLFSAAPCVSAEEIYDFTPVYDSLSDEAAGYLQDIGADSADAATLSALDFSQILSELEKMAAAQSQPPLAGLIHIVAVLLICALLSAYQSGLSVDMSNTLGLAAALCISCAVLPSAIEVIHRTTETVASSSKLVIACVPVMTLLMTASGHPVSSAAYYAATLGAGEGVLALSEKVIIPFLSMSLGLSVSAGVAPKLNLSGFTQLLSRVSKWLLGFVMAVFTAVLSARTAVGSGLDNVSGRTVKFALSSFVPVVGGALSEAYRTVLSSVTVLKSGLGVFVILALCLTFLPLLLQCLLWLTALSVGDACAQALGLPAAAKLLMGVKEVFSLIIAILLCAASIYIISTALAINGASA